MRHFKLSALFGLRLGNPRKFNLTPRSRLGGLRREAAEWPPPVAAYQQGVGNSITPLATGAVRTGPRGRRSPPPRPAGSSRARSSGGTPHPCWPRVAAADAAGSSGSPPGRG